MRRLMLAALGALALSAAGASTAAADTGPTVAASFAQSTATIGSTDQLTFTITGGSTNSPGFSIAVYLPGGLNVAAATSAPCGGQLTLKQALVPREVTTSSFGSYVPPEISFAAGSIPAGQTCTVTVPVQVQGTGDEGITALYGVTGSTLAQTTAALTVPATASPATVTSAFTPSVATASQVDGTSWTVAIKNPNPTTTLHDLRFLWGTFVTGAYTTADKITADTCGGTGQISDSSGAPPYATLLPYVNYGGGTLAPGASCAITVSMESIGTFGVTAFPVTVSSDEGGDSAVSNATLASINAPGNQLKDSPRPSNVFTHAKPKGAANGTVTAAVTFPNPGKLVATLRWKGKQVAHVTKTVKAGKVTLKLTPNKAARAKLKKHHRATLKLALAFTPTGGVIRTVKLTVRTPK